MCVRAIEVEDVERRANQVRVGVLKSHVSFRGEEGAESPKQIIRLPCDSGDEKTLEIREGSLAIMNVICSL